MTSSPAADVAMAQRLAARLAKAKAKSLTAAAQAISPRPAGGPILLSPAQRRLWFLHQWAPESAAYSIPVAWRLRGPLDVDRLIAALRSVVDGHEILRTRYPSVDGEPSAELDAASPLPIPVVEAWSDLDAQLVAFGRMPFRLADEWPIRATLLRVGAQDHVLAVCLHHIASDGWSVGLLAGQISAAYAGSSALGHTVQYADVTHARQEVRHPADLAYWTERLADLPAALELPADRPRPAVAGDEGAIHTFTIDAATSAAVREFAAAERATSFMCVTAALTALCARYSSTEDVAVGTPIAGRDPAVADVMGCFINTVVLRNRVTPELTGRELVQRVRSSVLADLEHGALPYEELVEALPGRSGGGGLFTVQVVATNVPRTPLALGEVQVEEVAIDPAAAKLDLSLAVEDLGDPAMPAELTYRTDLFDAATVQRFAAEFVALLRGIVSQPELAVAAVDVLSPADRAMVLAEPSTVRASHRTILDAISAHVRRTPERTAVVAADGKLSYVELDRRADALAATLLAAGVGAQQPVGLDADRSIDFVVGLLGIMRAGAAYLPLEPDLPAARRSALLAAAGADHHVGGAAVRWPEAPQRPPAPVVLPEVDPGHLAYVIFTSGSTGLPKPVGVEHGQLMAYLDSVTQRLATPEASYAVCSTLAADLGHTMVFGALATGGTLRIVDRDAATDPRLLAALLRSDPVDVAKLVPSHLAALLAAAEPADAADLLPTRLLVLGGEAASWELVDRVRALRPDLRVLNHYGPTEATVGVLTYEIGADRRPAVPLGTAMPHVAVRIVDPDGRPVPVGVAGELWLGGAAVARGYLGQPEETGRRFGPGPDRALPGDPLLPDR